MKPKKKLLLIGWDAADWEIINPLMEQGLMPTLKKFLSESAYGNIATLDPPYSPMLWTSIATGKHAFDHGVLGFTELLPDGSGIRPISAHSRKVKALWNIFNQEGLKSNVVSWWPSNPVEDINGVMVSNFYQHARTKYEEEWPLLEGTINDEKHREPLAKLRIHPQELTAAHIQPFIPNLKSLKTEEDKVLAGLVKILAHASSVHSATTYLMEETEWDFMAVYHDAIDHICHLAMKYRAPQLKGIEDEAHENYKDLVDSMYRYHDMMLDRTLDLIDDDTYMMILSDHGFRSDHTRMVKVPKGPATPALEHRPYGIVALRGPGIKKGEKIFGASLMDVTPTLLHIMGLPVGSDMAGNVLKQAFENAEEVKYIPSWEERKGDAAMLSNNATSDPEAEQQAMEQLIELGYVEKQSEDNSRRLAMTKRESQINLARSYVHAGKTPKAVPVLEEIVAENPHKPSRLLLISCYLSTGELSKAEALINECKEHYKDSTNLIYYEGLLHWQKNRTNKAMAIFEKVAKNHPTVETLVQIAKAYNAQGLYKKAQEMLEKALEAEEENSFLYHQLGIALYYQGELEQALENFLKVINIFYHFPKAHSFIGEILYKMELYENAAEAWELAATMAPKDNTIRKWLIKVYSENLNQPERVQLHQQVLPEKAKEIVVVSGLPRSGTSMMMQILEKGGITPLTDYERQADNNNPHGYYEYEPVKKLALDATWMAEAEGKSIKVIAQLLPYLPAKHSYKIVLMDREISEVLISQQRMLGKTREEAIRNYPFKMAQTFFNQIEKIHQWVDKQPNVELLIVKYQDAIDSPDDTVNRVANFLDREMDTSEMLKAIDKKLYRNQTT